MTLADVTRASVGRSIADQIAKNRLVKNGVEKDRHAESRVGRLARDFVAYGLVSVVALAFDYGLLLILVSCGLYYLAASTISFSIGMAVAYALSIRFVFAKRRALSREAEAAGFFAVGFVGLVLTQALLYALVAHGGMSVAAAKIPTTGLVFLFNFLCRRGMVFTGSRRS